MGLSARIHRQRNRSDKHFAVVKPNAQRVVARGELVFHAKNGEIDAPLARITLLHKRRIKPDSLLRTGVIKATRGERQRGGKQRSESTHTPGQPLV